MYGIGIVIISLSYTFIPLIIGLMLAEFGVGESSGSRVVLEAQANSLIIILKNRSG